MEHREVWVRGPFVFQVFDGSTELTSASVVSGFAVNGVQSKNPGG